MIASAPWVNTLWPDLHEGLRSALSQEITSFATLNFDFHEIQLSDFDDELEG